MGLDSVEIVLRVEEFYSIAVTDHEAEEVRTVGDLYKLICAKLNVEPIEFPKTPAMLPMVSEEKWHLLFLRRTTPLAPPTEVLPWTPQSIWDSLVAVLADQQCLDPEEILFTARFVEDLGVD